MTRSIPQPKKRRLAAEMAPHGLDKERAEARLGELESVLTTKPFSSKRQWRWAFASGQPWARRWAHHTPGGKVSRFRKLPNKVTTKAWAVDYVTHKEAQYNGAMIALFVPEKEALEILSLAQPYVGPHMETPQQLHLTLAYLGPDAEDLADVGQMIAAAVTNYSVEHILKTGGEPLTVTVGGIGRFMEGDKGCLFLTVDSEALQECQRGLMAELAEQGINLKPEHAFYPHITIAYLPEGAPTPTIQFDPFQIEFETLTLAWGGIHADFALTAPKSPPAGVAYHTKPATKPGGRNYAARAGQQIAGNLCRSASGKFGACGSGDDGAPSGGGRDRLFGASPSPDKAGGGGGGKGGGGGSGKGKKGVELGKLTPEQAAEAQNKLATDTLAKLQIAPDGVKALQDLLAGKQADPEALARAGFEKAGLVRKTAEGGFELTPAGANLLKAASKGDLEGAGKQIEASRAKIAERNAKYAQGLQKGQGLGGKQNLSDLLSAQKKPDEPKKGGGGGGGGKKDKPKPKFGTTRVDRVMDGGQATLPAPTPKRVPAPPSQGRDRDRTPTGPKPGNERRGPTVPGRPAPAPSQPAPTRRAEPRPPRPGPPGTPLPERPRKRRPPGDRLPGGTYKSLPASFTTFKQADGKLRWVMTSSNAYEDREKQYVTEKSLTEDVARTDKTNDYGPLRWWHMGKVVWEVPGDWRTVKAGPGIDFGQCDFSMMVGRLLVESGTFYNDAVGAKIAQKADQLQASLGFAHPPDEPDASGAYWHIKRFERSLTPKGRASNPFTSFSVKEQNMDAANAKKIAALKSLGLDDTAIEGIINDAQVTQKAIDEQGVKFKSYTAADIDGASVEDLHAMVTNLSGQLQYLEQSLALKAAEVGDEVDSEEDIVLKAEDDEEGEDEDEELEYMDDGLAEPTIGQLTVSEFQQIMADSFAEAMAPMQKSWDLKTHMTSALEEMKALVEGKSLARKAADPTEQDRTDVTDLAQKIEQLQVRLKEANGSIDDLTSQTPPAVQTIHRPSRAADNVIDTRQITQKENNGAHPLAWLDTFVVAPTNGNGNGHVTS